MSVGCCPQCGGTGADWGTACTDCYGTGCAHPEPCTPENPAHRPTSTEEK